MLLEIWSFIKLSLLTLISSIAHMVRCLILSSMGPVPKSEYAGVNQTTLNPKEWPLAEDHPHDRCQWDCSLISPLFQD